MRAAREAWFEAQPDLNPERMVIIDETAATTTMIRRFGRAPRGQRCRMAAPHGHYKTTTVTAALRASGPFAIDLMDGATNGTRFRTSIADVLAPALKRGDTVVMDNLPPPPATPHSFAAQGLWQAPPTKSPASNRPSRPPERISSPCRPTVLTSTRVWMAPAGQGI